MHIPNKTTVIKEKIFPLKDSCEFIFERSVARSPHMLLVTGSFELIIENNFSTIQTDIIGLSNTNLQIDFFGNGKALAI